MNYQYCRKCLIEKPIEEYSRYKRNKNGYKSICKSCIKTKNELWSERNKKEREAKGEKGCRRCLIVKSYEYFSKDSKRRDGYNLYCNSCLQKYRREKAQDCFVTEKKCSGCKMVKTHKEFYKRRYRKNGLDEYCISCHRLKKYNLSEEQYKEMFLTQKGLCKICGNISDTNNVNGERKALSVDHCHQTGKVRGLLCHRCNMALGCINDDIKIAQEIIKYLKEKYHAEEN